MFIAHLIKLTFFVATPTIIGMNKRMKPLLNGSAATNYITNNIHIRNGQNMPCVTVDYGS